MMAGKEEMMGDEHEQVPRSYAGHKWGMGRKILVTGLAVIAIVIVLCVGVGIGVREEKARHSVSAMVDADDFDRTEIEQERSNLPRWQPAIGTSFQIVLSQVMPLTNLPDADVFDIDLFDTPTSEIKELQNRGKKVICYFSAGTAENWRPDYSKFKSSSIGKAVSGWGGENYVNTAAADVRAVMQNRIALAASKGCDGVDPDNVDSYLANTGFSLTSKTAISYINWLAAQANAVGLSMGLKNAGLLIPSVIGNLQWGIQEQCVQYGECATYQPIIAAGKPVFHIEYPASLASLNASFTHTLCHGPNTSGFTTILKNELLDVPLVQC